MTSSCIVSAAFEAKLSALPLKLRQACHDGMAVGMKELETVARNEARWQEDGTDNGKWLVTGSARISLDGYTLGDDPNYPSFDFRDPVYHTRHHSPTSAFPSIEADPTTIVGVLTLAEDTAGGGWGSNLQKYESEGASTMSPGEPVTTQTVHDNKEFLWGLIKGAVDVELRP